MSDDSETYEDDDEILTEEINGANRCKYHARPCPVNRAILALLVVSSLERYAFYNVTDDTFKVVQSYITNKPELNYSATDKRRIRTTVLAEIVINSIPFLLYPFAGYLADVKFGRLKVITAGVGMCAASYGVLTLIFTLGYAKLWFGWSIAIPFGLSFLVLCAGSAAVQVNMVPFLADQVMRAWGEELSSLFHWYYWTRNVSGISTIIQLLISCRTTQRSDKVTAYATFAASAVALSLAFCVILCCKRWFYNQEEIRNPLQLVARVVCYARKATYDPFESAFLINRDPPPRLDLAKMRYGGPFTTSQVENVKTFYRLSLVLISTIGALMLITAIITVLQLESSSLIKKYSCIVDGGPLLQVAEDLSILLFIPFLDKLLYPLLGGYTPNMKNRIWIGSVLCVLAAAALIAMMYSAKLQSGFLSVTNHDDFSYHWYIPAVAIVSTVVLGLSEVLIEVGALEFAYAQASRDMKGFMIGLFYFTWGLGSLVAEIILYVSRCLAIVGILSVIGLVLFTLISYNYKHRKLDDVQADLDNLTYESALGVLRSRMRAST